jgi:predicted transcriptional regulator
MKVKKFKIKIQSGTQFRDDVIQTWKAAEKGALDEDEYDLVLSFPDLSWLSKIFGAERIRLIQTVRDRKPESIYQLAKMLGRALPNVHRDVHELAEYGIIELKKVRKKGQKRESLHPEYNWDGFDIAV